MPSDQAGTLALMPGHCECPMQKKQHSLLLGNLEHECLSSCKESSTHCCWETWNMSVCWHTIIACGHADEHAGGLMPHLQVHCWLSAHL